MTMRAMIAMHHGGGLSLHQVGVILLGLCGCSLAFQGILPFLTDIFALRKRDKSRTPLWLRLALLAAGSLLIALGCYLAGPQDRIIFGAYVGLISSCSLIRAVYDILRKRDSHKSP